MHETLPHAQVINLLHLSDIHFGENELGAQFDRDLPLRKALATSLENLPDRCATFDAIVISGDIAFSGHHKEYDRADNWLGELTTSTGVSRDAIYVVPGNHDVDRKVCEREKFLWLGHEAIRKENSQEAKHGLLKKQLNDPGLDALIHLKNFNAFAQRYECRTLPSQLSWLHELEVKLSDGTKVVLHGLNSALVSDADDTTGSLFVSDFQLGNLERSPGCVHVCICHHPPSWLCDATKIQDLIFATCEVTLFGHEHTSRCRRTENTVQIFSGAVQPSRNEIGWQPCYNIIQLEIVTIASCRNLKVKVWPRSWKQAANAFLSEPEIEYVLPLANWERRVPSESPPSIESTSVDPAPNSEPQLSKQIVSPHDRRRLFVNFFGLGTPLRYTLATKLGLFREGDDNVRGQELWTVILKRAEDEGALAKLWDEVAVYAPELKHENNPFNR